MSQKEEPENFEQPQPTVSRTRPIRKIHKPTFPQINKGPAAQFLKRFVGVNPQTRSNCQLETRTFSLQQSQKSIPQGFVDFLENRLLQNSSHISSTTKKNIIDILKYCPQRLLYLAHKIEKSNKYGYLGLKARGKFQGWLKQCYREILGFQAIRFLCFKRSNSQKNKKLLSQLVSFPVSEPVFTSFDNIWNSSRLFEKISSNSVITFRDMFPNIPQSLRNHLVLWHSELSDSQSKQIPILHGATPDNPQFSRFLSSLYPDISEGKRPIECLLSRIPTVPDLIAHSLLRLSTTTTTSYYPKNSCIYSTIYTNYSKHQSIEFILMDHKRFTKMQQSLAAPNTNNSSSNNLYSRRRGQHGWEEMFRKLEVLGLVAFGVHFTYVVLEPGESVFVPSGYHHSVRRGKSDNSGPDECLVLCLKYLLNTDYHKSSLLAHKEIFQETGLQQQLAEYLGA